MQLAHLAIAPSPTAPRVLLWAAITSHMQPEKVFALGIASAPILLTLAQWVTFRIARRARQEARSGERFRMDHRQARSFRRADWGWVVGFSRCTLRADRVFPGGAVANRVAGSRGAIRNRRGRHRHRVLYFLEFSGPDEPDSPEWTNRCRCPGVVLTATHVVVQWPA